jgi:hypothetical protein
MNNYIFECFLLYLMYLLSFFGLTFDGGNQWSDHWFDQWFFGWLLGHYFNPFGPHHYIPNHTTNTLPIPYQYITNTYYNYTCVSDS